MAFSRSATRTARTHRRWLWALSALGGAAGLVVAEEKLREDAKGLGKTTSEYAQERAREVAGNLREASGVAGALLRTASSSALDAVQQRNFDADQFQSALAATVADLVTDLPSRRQLLSLGGGHLLDWLLSLAYPDTPSPLGGGMGPGAGGGSSRTGGVADAGAGFSRGAAGKGGEGGSGGQLLHAVAAAAEAAMAVRGSVDAERALEVLLRDDSSVSQLLGRPGAVPRMLGALAAGRAGGGVAAALAARAAEARLGEEAMTADLQAALEALRGRGAGARPGVQRVAAGLLSAWAAGSGANRAKLTGLGLQGALAEVATAVSGSCEGAAAELQWELLRLMRVMAEHASAADSHHLAHCVLPLLYTAADAAAGGDAAMASYAVDTLAAAVRHGGAPVSERVSSSTLPHLLWQLAESMGAKKVPTAAPAAAPPSAGDGGSEGAEPAAAVPPPPPQPTRTWRWGFFGTSTPAPPPAPAAPPAAAPAAPPPRKPKKDSGVMQIKDPVLITSVAAAVAQLAASGLLPELHVPRWRDWLLDVMCADGFDTGLGQAALGSLGAAPGAAGRATPASTSASAWQSSNGAGDMAAAKPAATVIPSTPAPAAAKRAAVGSRKVPAWLTLPTHGSPNGSPNGGSAAVRPAPPGAKDFGPLRDCVVAALAALSHMPGNHGLQAAHYWLSRLLSELAARTLPYTSLVYAEGPRDPQALVNAVPVGPTYVRTVADALERAADAVAEDTHPLPPHLAELDLAGSGIVGRPQSPAKQKQKRQKEEQEQREKEQRRLAQQKQRPSGAEAGREQALKEAAGADQEAAEQAAAYRNAAHVVDVVLAERKAADALEALCAIVAPDPVKQRWLLARGVLPLMHRLTRTADDPRVALPEAGQPGAEHAEAAQAAADAATAAALGAAAGTVDVASPVVISELMSDREGGPSLCLQRQVARMLALLALLPEAQRSLGATAASQRSLGAAAAAIAVELRRGRAAAAAADGASGSGWQAWLRAAARSSDCRLSSNATRALLHVAAVSVDAAAATATATAAPWGVLTAVGAAEASTPPVFLDGIHLLDPAAPHHWALVEEAAAARARAEAVAPALAPAEDARALVAPALPTGQVGAGIAGVASTPVAPLMQQATDAAASDVPKCVTVTVRAGEGDKLGTVTGTAGGASVAVTVSSTLWSTLSYLASGPLTLWGQPAAIAGGGAPPTSSLPPTPLPPPASPANVPDVSDGGTKSGPDLQPPAVAATTAAPAQHDARPGGGSTAPGGNGSSNGSSAGPGGGANNGTSGGASMGADLLPAAAVPPYPAPYPDLSNGNTDGDTATGDGYAPPLVDVVFVHGIRGGPFITWRKAGVMTRGSAASHMERSACWPSTWLAEDFPHARLLSVEYLAPVSAWEGESLPLEDNVSRVMGQLAAAGVGTGQRPVVFVAHSMGGLLVKEMLARSCEAAEQGGPHASLAASTRGIVFYGTPHFGNNMAAMGWKLRHVPGALPAPSLARLTPGPHLLSLNQRLKQLHDSAPGRLRIVSLLEGQPTQLSGVIPRILIVAPDSAYPGFGAAMPLPYNDHIDCCKPAGREDPVYGVVRDALRHAMRAAAPGGG